MLICILFAMDSISDSFIYDIDIDYTRTAYNLMKKYDYKVEFYYINFDNLSRSYRFNPLKKCIG